MPGAGAGGQSGYNGGMTPEERALAVIPARTWLHADEAGDIRREVAAAVRAAVAEEREACARLADEEHDFPGANPTSGFVVTARKIAAAIRARG